VINMVIESSKLVEIITSKIKTIVIIINPEGELLYVSQSVKRILGYEPIDLLGAHWWQATRKDESSAFKMIEQFKEAVKHNRIDELSTERLLFDADNNKVWILWNSSLDEDGNVISVGYDITNRKINEERLSQTVKLLKNTNKEMVASLNYAQTIQHSILPNSSLLGDYFSNYFVTFKPKDIVSGDFYFFYELDGLLFVACIDCTGHGVPGALMTILANNLLKSVIKHHHYTNPAGVLHALDQLLYDEFNRNNKVKRADGMDISLCVFNFKTNTLQFAGAHHSLLVYKSKSKKEIELKGNRYPIGLYHDVEKNFESQKVIFEKGDRFFLFTDGTTDQFGGENDKKFTKKRLKEQLFQDENLLVVQQEYEFTFDAWRGKCEQTDDILLIGLEF
jgi:PAS domain S-box-containing protein